MTFKRCLNQYPVHIQDMKRSSALYVCFILFQLSHALQNNLEKIYCICLKFGGIILIFWTKKKKIILFVFLRDGPDQTSPQIGQFSGNTALESVYSTSNQILIKFHSDFTTSGFFVLSYHGKCDKLNFFTVYTGQWRKTRHKKISWFF